VIEALAAKTGVRIHAPALPDQPVTADCAAEAVKPVLECLLGGPANLMIRYADGRPAEIWVLASSLGSGQSSGEAATPPPTPAQAPAAKPELAALSADELLALAASNEPGERRVNALSRLIAAPSTDPALLRNALETALTDADGEVRAQAVFGLARQDGGESPEQLQSALSDRDSSVRLMAVDMAGSDAQSVEFLRTALKDRDHAVRDMAALKLEEAAETAARR
jgi:hypothetical protein